MILSDPYGGRLDGADGDHKYLTPLASNKTAKTIPEGLNICRTLFSTLSGRPRRGRTFSIQSVTVRLIKHDKVRVVIDSAAGQRVRRIPDSLRATNKSRHIRNKSIEQILLFVQDLLFELDFQNGVKASVSNPKNPINPTNPGSDFSGKQKGSSR